jgi:hypothetical protein
MVLGAPALAERGVAQGRRDVKWLPYHRFELSSPLRPAEAQAAMAARIEPFKIFRMTMPGSQNDTRFEGEATANGFRVQRIIGYRNSFLPKVVGEISGDGKGSRVRIEMRPNTFVYVFCALWVIVLVAAILAQVYIVAPFMLLMLWGMAMIGFWMEAPKQERVLRQIFKADPAENGTPLVS